MTSVSDEVSFISLSDASAVQDLIEYFDSLASANDMDAKNQIEDVEHLNGKDEEKCGEKVTKDGFDCLDGTGGTGDETVTSPKTEQFMDCRDSWKPYPESQLKTINTTSMESLFKKKNRRKGDLKLSNTDSSEYSDSKPGNPIMHDKVLQSRDKKISPLKTTGLLLDPPITKQTVYTSPKHSIRRFRSGPLWLFGIKDKPQNTDGFVTDGTTSRKTTTVNVELNPSLKGSVNGSIIGCTQDNIGHDFEPKLFMPNNMELFFNDQLNNDKVVPLSKVIFNNHHNEPIGKIMSKKCSTTTQPSVESSHSHHFTRSSLRAMLDKFSWRKNASDSADFENKIFSPGSHRPSSVDVPGIYEVESEEENLEDDPIQRRKLERGRSHSTLSSLFANMDSKIDANSPHKKVFEFSNDDNDAHDNNDNDSQNFQQLDSVISPSSPTSKEQTPEPLRPAMKRSRWVQHYQTLKAKSPSLRVRFLSPISSPWNSS